MHCRWQGLVLNPSLKSNFPLISASASKSFLHTKEWRARSKQAEAGGTFFQIFNQWRAFSKLPRHQSKQAKAQNFYPLNHLPTFPSSIWFFKSKILAKIQKFFRLLQQKFNLEFCSKSCDAVADFSEMHNTLEIFSAQNHKVYESGPKSLIL